METSQVDEDGLTEAMMSVVQDQEQVSIELDLRKLFSLTLNEQMKVIELWEKINKYSKKRMSLRSIVEKESKGSNTRIKLNSQMSDITNEIRDLY